MVQPEIVNDQYLIIYVDSIQLLFSNPVCCLCLLCAANGAVKLLKKGMTGNVYSGISTNNLSI